MNKDIDLIKRKTLYKGFYELYQFTFRHKKYDNTWSKQIKREVFSGSQVATVLPYDPQKNELILIDQFRPGLINSKHEPNITEIVAGIIDEGENPEEAAIRECKEETGCDINKLKKILTYFPAPGSSQSYYHLFFAEVNSFKGSRILGKEDEGEDILVRSYPVDAVKLLLKKGKIINGLTIIALQWFFLNNKKN